jgi:hypothetical protein
MPVVEREPNKFFRVLGFMAGNDSVMKSVEKILIASDELIKCQSIGFFPDSALGRICG